MSLKFTKMHGCGNDYVYINCFEEDVPNKEEMAIKLSNRNFGVGSDGVIYICPSEIADAKMRMFNLDGSEGKMCGNGIRCVAKYVYDYGINKSETLSIETLSGVKKLELQVENGFTKTVKVDMGKAILTASEIPVNIDGENVIDKEITVNNKKYNATCVSMGNPHCVIFCDNIKDLNLEEIGPFFEKSSLFPESVNTEFVEIVGENKLKMRVWERGSGETLACGTGACAVATAATLCGHVKKGEDVEVELLGGTLIINYTDETVFMTGPAETVFDGIM